MQNPTLNPSILLSPVEDGYVAYDPAADQLHHLNPLAALIAELCDGTRDLDQIRELVAPLLPAGSAGEVERLIEDAVKAGLFTPSAVSPGTYREMSADELAALAARLRDNGKTRTAFLCQRRAAELDAADPKKWSFLGDLAHILGRRDDARMAYGKYLELRPDNAEVQHLMVALRDGPPPSRVPDDCIQQLYRRFSSFYEHNVCDELQYEGPERIQAMVESAIGGRDHLALLDLGCGSGLAGMRLKPRASSLVGVDLSPEMIELARARNIYDRLDVAEITEWTGRMRERFDLIVACDCFIYFGDLGQVVIPAARLLQPDGTLAFTVEKGERYPFALSDSGRYTHHPSHVREVAGAAGLRVARFEEAFLRMEYGVEVTGLFVILQTE